MREVIFIHALPIQTYTSYYLCISMGSCFYKYLVFINIQHMIYFFLGFGMTETSCVACAFPATKPGRPGACGMLLAGCQAKVPA